MRPLLLLTAIGWLIGVVAAQAQTNTTPGMGPTSPMGIPSMNGSSSNASGLGGIPLGATEMNTPGVSPLVMPCPSTSSSAAFDGGGSGTSTNCASSNAGSFGAGSGAGTATTGPSGSVVGTGIPLGATDLGIPGESQIPAVAPVTPCLPSMFPPQGSTTASGQTSSTVNGGC